ncbi:MAG: lytic transglycosylase domain-containing protein [Acidobacteriota bacterium]
MSVLNKLLYKRIVFCPKCHRSMFVGLNYRYVGHLLRHTAINKLFILVAVAALISFSPSSISIMSAKKVGYASFVSEEHYRQERLVQSVLKKHSDMPRDEIAKLSKIIVRQASEKKLDPRLVASVIVVESRGNALAISQSKSVGVMQIHLPTWRSVIDFTEKNPFDPEVNVDIGTTILADYLKRYKTLEAALAAYEGSHISEENQYAARVLQIYQGKPF